MAKLRRTSGRPGTAKKTSSKPARSSKPSAKKPAKAVKKPTPAAKRPAKAKTPARPAPARRAAPAAALKGAGKAAPAKAVVVQKKGAGRAGTSPQPPARSSYAEAVGTYERAMRALQAKRYRDAAQLLKTVITTYPEEKELLERAQLYLRVCERQLAPLDATPKTPEERIYAATLALNSGDVERAVALLNAALALDASNDHAHYMLGVALATSGNATAAVAHLDRAVALNPETRDLIAKEPEFEALRQTEAVAALLAAPQQPAPARKDKDKRPAAKPKASR